MNDGLIRDLIINASLLITLSVLADVFVRKFMKASLIRQILLGGLVGAIGILLLVNSVNVSQGVIFDTRSILISICGMFFGFLPTAIAVLIICIYRIFIGGSGMLAGVIVTLLTAGIGVLWNHFRFRHADLRRKSIFIEFYLVGLVVHLGMLLCMFLLPADIRSRILGQITVPVLVIYPVFSTLLSMILLSRFKEIQLAENFEKSEMLFRRMFEQSPVGISIAANFKASFVNSKYLEITGRSRSELEKTDWTKFTHPDDLQEDLALFGNLRDGKIREYSLKKRFIKPDGAIVWVHMIVVSLQTKAETEFNHLCMIQDITDVILSAEQIQESERKYKSLYHEYQEKELLLKALLNSIPDLIFYKDQAGIYMGCNGAFEKFTGKKESEIVGRSDYELFETSVAELFRQMDSEMMHLKQSRRNEESVVYPDGRPVTLETLKSPYYTPDGDLLGLIGISRDISERKAREKEILYLNYHDILTGLFNRTFFEQELGRIDAIDNLPLSILVGDINGLKLINDAFGHGEGDNLLREVAGVLQSSCRPGDIIARIGGDEFCVLLPKADNAEARSIFSRIMEACQVYDNDENRKTYYMSISLGYATKTNEQESFDELYKTAEEHMYRRKLLESKSLHSSIISSIKTTLNEKSLETEAHAERMAAMAKQLGKSIGLNEEDLVSVELAATLHDIGKISLDSNILAKTGKLNEADWIEIKKHPEVGFRIAQTVPELMRISEFILSHHERWDGKGYPQGLAGEDIPLISRIIAVVDSFDAMTQDRAYRKALTIDQAVQEIRKNAGTQFDPKLALVFVETVLGRQD